MANIAIKYQEMTKSNSSLPKIPFVFCGVSREAKDLPSSIFSTEDTIRSISGISLVEPFQYKVDALLKAAPNATKINFIFDNSEESAYQIESLRSLISSSSLNLYGLPTNLTKVVTFQEFTDTISSLQNNTQKQGIIVVNSFQFLSVTGGNKSVEPNIISNWVLKNVGLDVMGPLEFGFSYNVHLNQTGMCDYAGLLASQVLDVGTYNVSQPVKTDFNNFYLENEIHLNKVDSLLNISSSAFYYFTDYQFMISANVYLPEFYVVIFFSFFSIFQFFYFFLQKENPKRLLIMNSYAGYYFSFSTVIF